MSIIIQYFNRDFYEYYFMRIYSSNQVISGNVMMSKVIGYLFYIAFYQHDFYLFLNKKCSLTSDVEQGFVAVADVSNVGSNTAKNSSV